MKNNAQALRLSQFQKKSQLTAGMECENFHVLWVKLCSCYPRHEISEREYYEHLKHVRKPALERAIRRLVQQLKFFPTVAEILEQVRNERPQKRRPKPEEEPERFQPGIKDMIAELVHKFDIKKSG